MKNLFNIFFTLTFLFFTLLWLSSYSYHSAIGVDSDQHVGSDVLAHYYRLNWSGNGSLYIGKGVTKRRYKQGEPLDSFDWAAVFFQTVFRQQPEAKSIFNRLGFWYITQPKQHIWFGIPAWLPVVLSAFFWFLFRK